MKKISLLLLLCMILSGCILMKEETRVAEEEVKEITCEIKTYGIKEIKHITLANGEIATLEYQTIIKMDAFNVDISALSNEEVDALVKETMKETYSSQIYGIKGVEITHETIDKDLIITIHIDFRVANLRWLSGVGLISKGDGNVSVKQSIEALEKEGYTCN